MLNLINLWRRPERVLPDLSDVAHDGDRQILRILAGRGDALTPARHTLFCFLRRPDDTRDAALVFEGLSAEARALGFTVSPSRDDGLILEIDQSMDAAVVNAARVLMEDWAARFGVSFDGWECQVRPG